VCVSESVCKYVYTPDDEKIHTMREADVHSPCVCVCVCVYRMIKTVITMREADVHSPYAKI
jgi:hypothetical protein